MTNGDMHSAVIATSGTGRFFAVNTQTATGSRLLQSANLPPQETASSDR